MLMQRVTVMMMGYTHSCTFTTLSTFTERTTEHRSITYNYVEHLYSIWKQEPPLETRAPIGNKSPHWKQEPPLETRAHIGNKSPHWKQEPQLETRAPIGNKSPHWKQEPPLESKELIQINIHIAPVARS